MSRRRGKILHLVNITKQERRGVALMDGWREGGWKSGSLRGTEKDNFSLFFLSVWWQVCARVIKELKNVHGSCNDLLMSLTGNFSKKKKKRIVEVLVWGYLCSKSSINMIYSNTGKTWAREKTDIYWPLKRYVFIQLQQLLLFIPKVFSLPVQNKKKYCLTHQMKTDCL